VNFVERVMRIMTHINIGAALGMVAWVLWSGWQVVTGQIGPIYRASEAHAQVSSAHTGKPTRTQPKLVLAGDGAPSPCHTTMPTATPAALVFTGADL
jgi:hypothetical protein